MRITDAIRGEHAAMRPLLRHVRESTRGGAPPAMAMANARAIKTIIRAHTTVEMPCLLGPLRNQKPVKEVVAKHRDAEVLLDNSILTGSARNLHKAVLTILDYFDREEREIFPLACKVLTPSQQMSLGTKWASMRGLKL